MFGRGGFLEAIVDQIVGAGILVILGIVLVTNLGNQVGGAGNVSATAVVTALGSTSGVVSYFGLVVTFLLIIFLYVLYKSGGFGLAGKARR